MIENIKQPPSSLSEKYEGLKEKMRNVPGIEDVDLLTDLDWKILEKIENKTLREEDFSMYQRKILEEFAISKIDAFGKESQDAVKRTRQAFLEYAADRAQILFLNRDRDNASHHTSVETHYTNQVEDI